LRHLPRAFAQGGGAFRFQRARPSELELAGHLAHSAPQHLELRRAAARRRRRQRFAAPDALRPSDELLQWPAEIAREVSRDARSHESDQQSAKSVANASLARAGGR